ncbi:UNVERIFIED_CONTAM: hypothetical protein GTU68_016044 [Idotea baltica]|nr:hypothetical protein [Idotea baltica]
MIEALAETDENIMEKYIGGEDISEEEIKKAIREATLAMEIFPVLCGSAFKNKGVQPLLDAVIDYLPSPLEVPAITGSPEDAKSSEDQPFAALAFKIITDPYVGVLTFFRVYSGKITPGSTVYNASQGRKERIGRILKIHAEKMEDVKEIGAGGIAAAVGLKDTITGDTICDMANPIILETINAPDPVISIAIEPKTKADEEKMGISLMKLVKEDPSLRLNSDQETGQTIIAGMGELHLEVIQQRLHREFKVETNIGKPQVAYRETIKSGVKHNYKYAKQSGGRGQFAEVYIEIKPRERGEGFLFTDEIKGGTIPKEYIPAVKAGIVEAMAGGVLAGYALIDIEVTLYDGSFHEVDSSEMAFRICSSICFKEACKKAGIDLLEPIMSVEVTSPDDFVSSVVGDLNRRRAKILGMDPRAGAQGIKSEVPLSEMFGYATDLRSLSQGRANFVMEYNHYSPVPTHVAESVINK